MVSDKSKQFDFLFVVTAIPTDNSGGSRILYSLARRLSDHGYSVGWVVWFNPYRFIYKVTRDRSLLPYVERRKSIRRVLYEELFGWNGEGFINPLKSKFAYVLRSRFMKGANLSEYDLEGISILYPLALRKVAFKRLIASPWETAYFVSHYNAECAKYNIIQYDVDVYLQDYYPGMNVDLVSQTFSFPLKKIVINEAHLTKFSADKPQKLQLGIDARKFYRANLFNERDGRTVLFPLRAPLEKGARVALDAIKLIHEQRNDIKIITFGNYGQTDTIPKYVDHRGYVDNTELFNLYNKASVFVIPSLAEAFCLPGLEAMACGCAVITADNVGIREYVKHNVNGLIVPPNDSEAIAKAVISLIDDSNQRNYLILNGLETARTFSDENMMRSFLTTITNFEQERHNSPDR